MLKALVCGDIFAVFGVEKLKVGANKREKVEINWSLMNESQSLKKRALRLLD